jgi:DNA-binding response OmpR family regulator
MKEIFIAEDHDLTADSLIRVLSSLGYRVTHRADGLEALKHIRLRRNQIDLAILDIGLPGIDGITLCKMIRAEKIDFPILMLTSLDNTESVVNALGKGADDYLTKPFITAELHARIRSLLRRPVTIESYCWQAGPLKVDSRTREAVLEGRLLPLRKKEFDILFYLVKNSGQTLSRDQIIASAWGVGEAPNENVIDVYIKQLRNLLGSRRDMIKTVHGVGYKLQPLEVVMND